MKRIEQITSPSATSQGSSSSARRSFEFFGGRSRGLGAGLMAAVLGLAVGAVACMSAEHGNVPQQAQSNGGAEIAWLPQQVKVHNGRIEAAARRHGIDPKLLAVMTLVESSGDPNAKSSQGALGLMQLMPQTAEFIARRRGQSEHTTARLLEPDYNLDMAAYFIADLYRNVADNSESEKVRRVAIAYNAGPEMLKRYLSGEAELYEETARYQKLVSQLWQDRDAGASQTFEAMGALRNQ